MKFYIVLDMRKTSIMTEFGANRLYQIVKPHILPSQNFFKNMNINI